MPPLKSYKSIVLLLLLLAAWAFHFCYPAYYSVALARIKTEQREKVKACVLKETKVFHLSWGEYEEYAMDWGEELEIDDVEYDVVYTVRHKDSVICTVIVDDRETSLNNNYSALATHFKGGTPQPVSFCWFALIEPLQFNTNAMFLTREQFYTGISSQPLLAGIFDKVPRPPQG